MQKHEKLLFALKFTYGNLGSKKFPGEKTPGRRLRGRPRLTRGEGVRRRRKRRGRRGKG